MDDPEVPLRMHVDRIFTDYRTDHQKAHADAHAAHQKEHDLLDRAQSQFKEVVFARMEGINHIREEQARAESKYPSRSEWALAHEALKTEIANLARLVYIGAGILIAVQLIVEWFLRK